MRACKANSRVDYQRPIVSLAVLILKCLALTGSVATMSGKDQ